jgi:hypothetical protein
MLFSFFFVTTQMVSFTFVLRAIIYAFVSCFFCLQRCPNPCNNGSCVAGKCVCNNEWSGEACDMFSGKPDVVGTSAPSPTAEVKSKSTAARPILHVCATIVIALFSVLLCF